jgi:hypothetical protein
MSTDAAFAAFEKELNRLVASFERNLPELKSADYVEAKLREDFLNPFFRALGWDMENRAGLVQAKREVEVESRTQIQGRQKRADYLFRTEGRDRFVCEAKKPAEELHARYAFQAKRYAWNKDLPLAILTDFEELKIFIVGGKPRLDEPQVGEWKSWHFKQYPLIAQELWNLLARDKIAAGSIDQVIESLPKPPAGKSKARQQWLLKPNRSRSLDVEFLNLLDEARRELASVLLRHNDRDDLLEGTKLNEAIQRILDRILFLRICEDRDIDTGIRLDSIVETWRRNFDKEEGRRAHQKPLDLREEPPACFGASGIRAPKDSLWRAIVRHFLALDRRPPSHVPYFNGNLFKAHFCEELVVSDEWLAGFIADLSDEESPYLFNYIPVEILGTIYERFLGKIVRPHGKGATIEEKPEVRKAGGVYYTPRYIVNYIVEQTLGKLLDEIAGSSRGNEAQTASAAGAKQSQSPVTSAAAMKDFEKKSHALRVLDPACGSGSFLLRAFERVCEHWEAWFRKHPAERKKKWCWMDPDTNDVHLSVALKRQILTSNIYGVDIDASAVEVTQLSLYLKMLENENRTTLQRQRELLPGDDDPLLPPLENNIKCFNSLIGSDFSMIPEDLVRVNAADWNIQFPAIMKAGGFDAVIGNPPYILLQDEFRDDQQLEYFRQSYEGACYKLDTYHLFIERGIRLCRNSGRLSLITPSNFLTNNHLDGLRRVILKLTQPQEIVVVDGGVFAGVSVDSAIFVFRAGKAATSSFPMTRAVAEAKGLKPRVRSLVDPQRVLAETRALFTSGITTPGSALWDRLALGCPKLGDFADVNFGKQLRDRSKFRRDVIAVAGPRSVPRSHVACVTGKDVERYLLTWSKLACLKDTVAQSGGCWDEAKHEAKGKLLTRQIGQFPTFALDAFGYHCLNTIFMVTLREAAQVTPAFLLGVLNSKLLRALWVGRFYDQRQTFPKIKGTYLKELPVALPDFSKPADRARYDNLVVLVDKMLALVPKLRAAKSEPERKTLQNAVTATDQRIDELVYDLYGLTAKEREIVEASQPAAAPSARVAKARAAAKPESQSALL